MKKISLAKKRELMMLESLNVSKSLSESLKSAVFNPSLLGAKMIAMDLEGHVYFLFDEKSKANSVKKELKKHLSENEMIVADVEVENFYLVYGVKVKVSKLESLKLVYRLECNPRGFEVENVKSV